MKNKLQSKVRSCKLFDLYKKSMWKIYEVGAWSDKYTKRSNVPFWFMQGDQYCSRSLIMTWLQDFDKCIFFVSVIHTWCICREKLNVTQLKDFDTYLVKTLWLSHLSSTQKGPSWIWLRADLLLLLLTCD